MLVVLSVDVGALLEQQRRELRAHRAGERRCVVQRREAVLVLDVDARPSAQAPSRARRPSRTPPCAARSMCRRPRVRRRPRHRERHLGRREARRRVRSGRPGGGVFSAAASSSSRRFWPPRARVLTLGLPASESTGGTAASRVGHGLCGGGDGAAGGHRSGLRGSAPTLPIMGPSRRTDLARAQSPPTQRAPAASRFSQRVDAPSPRAAARRAHRRRTATRPHPRATPAGWTRTSACMRNCSATSTTATLSNLRRARRRSAAGDRRSHRGDRRGQRGRGGGGAEAEEEGRRRGAEEAAQEVGRRDGGDGPAPGER